MTQQEQNQLYVWQLQRSIGIKPENRKLLQDNEPSFYDLQQRLIAEQMGLR
jgi:hypothetical protein